MSVHPETFDYAFELAERKANAKKVFLETRMSRITYGEVCTAVRKLASMFGEWRLKPGDRVAFSTRNDIHGSVLCLALLRCGITSIFIDGDTKKARVEHLLSVSRPKALIADADLLRDWEIKGVEKTLEIDTRGSLAGFFGRLRQRNLSENGTAYPAILNRLGPGLFPPVIDPELDAYILFTSGTTSSPKGVRISRRALFAHLKTLSRQFEYSPESRILNILILSHADGIVQGPLLSFFNTAQLFRPMKFSIQQIPDLLDSIYHYRISHFISVPTMLSLIDQFGADQADAFLTEDFLSIISCAGLLEEDLWKRIEKHFQVRVSNLYGLTETVSGGLFSGPDDFSHRIGTVGKPVDCVVRIVDDVGNDVLPGGKGELLMKAESIMTGYLDAPEATAQTVIDGYLHTGDIAVCDEDGFYRIVGRKKSVIISGGVNVHPEEVTEVLNRHPLVREAVTLGEPDPVWGERIISAVVPRECGVSEMDLIAFCRNNLEEVKVPSRIAIVANFPAGRSGKVRLEELRAMLTSPNGPAGQTGDLTRRLLAAAALVFRVPVEELSLESTPRTTPGWDSLAHLELVAMLEKTFDIRFAAHEIMEMESLASAKVMMENRR